MPIDKRTLIVVPPEGKGDPDALYAIPYEVYTDEKYKLPPSAAGIVRTVVKYGGAFGYLPNVNVGMGSMCYLANLSSLRTETCKDCDEDK
jgi:hypothetical protein